MVDDTKRNSSTPIDAEVDSTRNDSAEHPSPGGEWLSPGEAGEYSGIKRTRLSGYLTSGAIPIAKLGRTRHIRRRDLDAFLEARMFPSGGTSSEAE